MPPSARTIGLHTARFPKVLIPTLRGVAMDLGILPYRPIQLQGADDWQAEYERGEWDYLPNLSELSRYSLLVGYVRFFGPARSLLDVGCGRGVLLDRLAEADFQQYVGIDVAPTVIARAKKREVQDRVSFFVGELPPKLCGRFQFVVCNEVLYYVDRPSSRLHQLRELIEPDGYLLTSIWQHRGHSGLRRLIQRWFDPVDSVQTESQTSKGRIRTTVSCWRPRLGASRQRRVHFRRDDAHCDEGSKLPRVLS